MFGSVALIRDPLTFSFYYTVPHQFAPLLLEVCSPLSCTQHHDDSPSSSLLADSLPQSLPLALLFPFRKILSSAPELSSRTCYLGFYARFKSVCPDPPLFHLFVSSNAQS